LKAQSHDAPLEASSEAVLAEPSDLFDLQKAFILRQEQLLATLGVGRYASTHPVVIGDSSELNWRGMLDSVLPTRYRVSKAFVIDSQGAKSKQIDVLIYDRQYSPMLLDAGDYVFVPAEATYAALEVKQSLSRQTVLYAADHVASIRRLHRSSTVITHAGGEHQPKAPHRILGGILTMGSDWQPPLGQPLEDALSGLDEASQLDIGCALSSGSFERDDAGHLTRSDSETALIFFVLRLLKRLQSFGTVPAIDYEEYSRALPTSAGSA
jgi:hypothetical protein